MAIKALMLDVDGVLIDGRPEDGRHWQSSVEAHFGFTSESLHQQLFAPYWDDIVVGRDGLMQKLTTALQKIAPRVSPADFLSYWFEKDSRIVAALLPELTSIRADGNLIRNSSRRFKRKLGCVAAKYC